MAGIVSNPTFNKEGQSTLTSLQFPSNIGSFPTYMQYTAYAFKPSEKGAAKETAFGNVGTVEEELAKIYLPALKSSISETQNWENESANNLMANVATAWKNGKGGFVDTTTAMVSAAASAATVQTKMGLANTLGTGSGFAVMEQQALKYTGPEQRELTCTYTFVPRSKEETQTIANIIRTFRYHSAPALSSIKSEALGDKMKDVEGGVRTYKFPSLFKISWLDNDAADIEWLPKYETCYCTSVAVEYGDDQFTTFHESKGAPTTYSLTLTFKELDYPTKGRIKMTGLGG
jgi:hypothetical protein